MYTTVLKLLGILFLISFANAASAQQAPTAGETARNVFDVRFNTAINRMIAQEDSENLALNAHINAMNAAAPLQLEHLDSTNIAANVLRILEFVEYLKTTRNKSDSLTRYFEDSLYFLSADLPPDVDPKQIKEVDISFREDRDAFNTFLDAMNKLYSDVLDVLLYLQHTPYTIGADSFTFSSKKNQTEYNKRMKIVDADSKELNKANDAMRQANAKANEDMKAIHEQSNEN